MGAIKFNNYTKNYNDRFKETVYLKCMIVYVKDLRIKVMNLPTATDHGQKPIHLTILLAYYLLLDNT